MLITHNEKKYFLSTHPWRCNNSIRSGCFCESLSAVTPTQFQHLLRHPNLDILQSPLNDVLILLYGYEKGA